MANSTAKMDADEAAVAVAVAAESEGSAKATGAADVAMTVDGAVVDLPNSRIQLALPEADITESSAEVALLGGLGESQVAVQDVGDQGQRVSFLVNGAHDPTEYRVELSGASSLVGDSTGGVVALDGAGQVVATVAAPWARDANGMDVPTRFVPDGTTVVQIVDHNAGTYAYPIVADPWVRGWWGITLYLNRKQTNNLMFGLAGATAASLFIPDATVTKVVAASLGLFTGYANWAYNRGACLAVFKPWVGAAVAWHYSGGFCR